MARSMKVRRDDMVKVIAGKDRGKTGRVLRVEPKEEKVYVEGLNIQKRHQRARAIQGLRNPQPGGVIEREGPIHVSNVMVLDPTSNEPTRLGVRREGGSRVRVARRSGEPID